MTNPRTVLFPAEILKPWVEADPSSSIIGVPAKPGWVVPSIVTGSVIVSRVVDEKRSKFRPNLWHRENDERFCQVWFAGVHSDVGGGYDDAGLSDVALDWMIDQARSFEVDFDDDGAPPPSPDPDATMHNPLWPLWWLLGWRRRTVPAGVTPWVHESVEERAGGDPAFAAERDRLVPPGAEYVV